jgi:hypothetical protein
MRTGAWLASNDCASVFATMKSDARKPRADHGIDRIAATTTDTRSL